MGKANNYIQMMYSQYGDTWIQALRPEDIQKQAKRIAKEMVLGKIDYQQVGKFFLDLKFLENLIIALSNELEINRMNYTACSYYYSYVAQSPDMATHIYHLDRVIYIYSTIIERLNGVKHTGDIGYLANISGILFSERNHLN